MLSRLKDNASVAALVLALIALFVAIGGVAGALPGKNTVNSGDIKKNTIRSSDIKNDKVTGADVKESTLKLPSSSVPKDVFGATVSEFGAVTQATLPGTTAGKQDPSTFTVNFPHSVSGCTAVASLQKASGVGEAGVEVSGSNSVRVITYFNSGAQTLALPFSVVVAC